MRKNLAGKRNQNSPPNHDRTVISDCVKHCAIRKLPQNILSDFSQKYACGNFLSLLSIRYLFIHFLLVQLSSYSATVTIVMCGFTPSYQYRKPCISMVWPTSRASTALYTSVVLSHR